MRVIVTAKRRHAFQEGEVHGSLSLKGAFPADFPSSNFLVKLFQLNRKVEVQALSGSVNL